MKTLGKNVLRRIQYDISGEVRERIWDSTKGTLLIPIKKFNKEIADSIIFDFTYNNILQNLKK